MSVYNRQSRIFWSFDVFVEFLKYTDSEEAVVKGNGMLVKRE